MNLFVARYIIYILFLCLPFIASAQDDVTIYTEPPAVDTTEYNTSAAEGDEEVTYEPPPPPVYTQRTFEDDFKERYKGREFNYRPKEESQSWFSRFMEWLNNLLDRIFGTDAAYDTEIAWKTIIYRVLLILVIGAAIYIVVMAIIKKEVGWIFRRSRKIIAPHDVDTEDIHVMDFSTLIQQTKESGNYRLAVRYYYLWLLKKLSVRELIAWNWDKTNSDYLYEIKDEALRKDFEYLSYLYDYSWYGEFTIDTYAFSKAEKAFQKTINTL
ncbi:hypothetical protein [Flavobacterium rhizosphaerae]|uniref:DUF4129 domain-containing protein n=1 Tax=Flavobacterium rhizosphaerae TaxID=3163298 RepID=A0ABW8Z0H6_9FLAO